MLRLCLKDKSSILIEEDMKNISYQTRNFPFLTVTNHNTKKTELYNLDYVWCIRVSSQI